MAIVLVRKCLLLASIDSWSIKRLLETSLSGASHKIVRFRDRFESYVRMKNLRIYRAKNIESSLNRLHLAVQSRNLRITLLSFLYIISEIKNFIDPWSHADEKLVIKIFSPEFSFPNFRREIINNLVSLIKNNTERKFPFVSTFAKIRGMWFVFFFFYRKTRTKKKNYLHRFFATNLTRIFIFV